MDCSSSRPRLVLQWRIAHHTREPLISQHPSPHKLKFLPLEISHPKTHCWPDFQQCATAEEPLWRLPLMLLSQTLELRQSKCPWQRLQSVFPVQRAQGVGSRKVDWAKLPSSPKNNAGCPRQPDPKCWFFNLLHKQLALPCTEHSFLIESNGTQCWNHVTVIN